MAMVLGKLGCSVSAVCPTTGHPLLKTTAVRRIFPYSAIHPSSSLISAIEAVDPDIIIPCDDRAVDHLHQLCARCPGVSPSKIASLIERSLGLPASYPIVSARYSLMKVAAEERIRVAATRLVSTVEDLKSWQT